MKRRELREHIFQLLFRVEFNGQEIVPIQFLKALLPDPASLGPRTVGKTNRFWTGQNRMALVYNTAIVQDPFQLAFQSAK